MKPTGHAMQKRPNPTVHHITTQLYCDGCSHLVEIFGYCSLWKHISSDSLYIYLSILCERAGSVGGVGSHACMWTSPSPSMLSSAPGKGCTVPLLPILGGWTRRARWWCRVRHSQAWTQRMPTFAFTDCCRERKNLLFHMLVLVATLPSTHRSSRCPLLPPACQSQPDGSLNIVYLGWQSQMQCAHSLASSTPS